MAVNRYKSLPAKKEWRRQRWLTTFNDMITLLMVFFVLLFAMGSIDVKRFKHFQNALQSAMGILHEGEQAPVGMISDKEKELPEKPKKEPVPSMAEPPQASDAPEDVPDFNRPKDSQQLKYLEDTKGLEAEYTRKGIQLTLKDNLLFQSGSARITHQGLALLAKISKVVKPLKRRIRVEGHTDDIPIATSQYPSNWELSTARATSVVKYFAYRGGIAANHLSAAGYGASKPRVPNHSAAQRARNRRVEIILRRIDASGRKIREKYTYGGK